MRSWAFTPTQPSPLKGEEHVRIGARRRFLDVRNGALTRACARPLPEGEATRRRNPPPPGEATRLEKSPPLHGGLAKGRGNKAVKSPAATRRPRQGEQQGGRNPPALRTTPFVKGGD